MKKKVFAIDIDGVICTTINSDYKNSKPNKSAINKINKLFEQGNEIIIFTARFMGRNNNNPISAHKEGFKFTSKQLHRWGVKYNKLIMGKPSFDLLIDDKAFNYSESWIEEI